MSRTAPLLLALLVAAAIAIVLTTSASLPATVATHFGAGGHANGTMTRVGYQLFYCALLLLLPLALYAGAAWLPARFPGRVNLPDRDYWLDPRRLPATLSTLRVFGVTLAAIAVAMLVGAHLLILDANARTPATLAESAFLGLVAAFVVFLIIWVILLYVQFRAPVSRR